VEPLLTAAHELGLGDLQGRGGDAGRLAHGGLSLGKAAGLRMLVVTGGDDGICRPCSSVLGGFFPSLLEG